MKNKLHQVINLYSRLHVKDQNFLHLIMFHSNRQNEANIFFASISLSNPLIIDYLYSLLV